MIISGAHASWQIAKAIENSAQGLVATDNGYVKRIPILLGLFVVAFFGFAGQARAMDTDWQAAEKACKAGARYCVDIVQAGAEYDIGPALAFALVDVESDFRNIFGCDQATLFCRNRVTNGRVSKLLRFVEQGGNSNGVGLTQITSEDLVRKAHKMPGGAEDINNQLKVGMGYLRRIINRYGKQGMWHYNGAKSYQKKLLGAKKRWAQIVA